MDRPVAIVFPGQGSQRLGMLDALPDMDGLPRLLDAAEALTGLDLRDIAVKGPADKLTDTRVAQPLLYLADWAWGRALIEAGLAPALVAGHSLGEFVALAIAGAFSVEAGLELVVERSILMARTAEASPGGMTAVIGMDAADIAAIVESLDGVWVANDNAPGQVVISGGLDALQAASVALADAGARRLIPLNVSGAFHSPVMHPAQEAFAELLDKVAFADTVVPVLQNTDPTPASAGSILRSRLAGQIASPVRWTGTMRSMLEGGVTTVIEAGPGSVLKGFIRRVDGLTAFSVEESGTDAILEEVS